MADSKKNQDPIEKKLEDKLADLENSPLGKVDKATSRTRSSSIKGEAGGCNAACPNCLSWCRGKPFHEGRHYCSSCPWDWS